jgi:hypothetical protein
MTAVPQDLAASAKERISADVAADVAGRLRMWAALRRKPAAHIVSELVCQGVPTAEQLAAQIHQNGGASNGHADH